MSVGNIVITNSHGPYDRYLDVHGIRLLVLPEVSSEFPHQIAQIYNSILSPGINTNSGLRMSLLQEIQSNQIGQRVGFSGPDYYERIGTPEKWNQYSGPVSLVDFIWESESTSTEIIAEVMEHQLHTLHVLAFTNLYPSQWDLKNPISTINLAMKEAVSGGYYNTEGMYQDVETPELNNILLQEFAFWFTVTAWDYIEDYFPNKEPEWTLKTSAELQENLPVTYKLYVDTVLPVLEKPKKDLLESLVFSAASTTTSDPASEDTSSEVSYETSSTDTIAFIFSKENDAFFGSTSKPKLAVAANKSDFKVKKEGDGVSWKISGVNIGVDTLTGFNRLEFLDGTLALDIDAGDTAGQAYRLYQAAFARTPDVVGVAYHINDMETHGHSITQIAGNFIASPEFKNTYGGNISEETYINLLYQNVLTRSPADFEVDYYKDRFEQGTTDWNSTLVFFAESPENVALVAPQIEDGIWMPI